ncbi:MAG: sugar phosphate nucleotidyltransferase [Candidatus Eisenbacteria bacterium]
MHTDVVVLAGGRGERFWPLSRRSRPKQVLRLLDDQSLLEATVTRALDGVSAERLWAIAPRDLKDVLSPEAPAIRPDRWLWETEGRNTGPAVAAAVAEVLAEVVRAGEEDRRILVLPADHWIPDSAAFWRTVRAGERVVDDTGRIVTFGIPVTRPETGYGYIERGDRIDVTDADAFVARRFHEKPDRATAGAYQAAGSFYWNAGIFLFSARTMAEELRRHATELAGPFDQLLRNAGEAARAAFFSACPSVAIDHAVMERSDRVAVVVAQFGWDDLGSWSSWSDLAGEDGSGNRVHGDAVVADAENNVVFSEEGGIVALIGVRDLVVVRTADATLVCPRDRVQEIRDLVRKGRTDGDTRYW